VLKHSNSYLAPMLYNLKLVFLKASYRLAFGSPII
jgi:hypothetical protein